MTVFILSLLLFPALINQTKIYVKIYESFFSQFRNKPR